MAIKKDTSNIILDAAKKIFTQKGFDGTSVEEIAKETGLSKASLYYYYVSKDEILYELIKRTLSNSLSYVVKELNKNNFHDTNSIAIFTKKLYKVLEQEKDVFKVSLVESLKLDSERNPTHQNLMFELLNPVFEEYEKFVVISNKDKSALLMLGISLITFLTLKSKLCENYNISIVELETMFKDTFMPILENIIRNLEMRNNYEF